jgi:hypothetical protein
MLPERQVPLNSPLPQYSVILSEAKNLRLSLEFVFG